MEYYPDHKLVSHPRVPVAIRAFVHQFAEHRLFKKWGTDYYRWAAERISRSFIKFHDVVSVHVIGGGLVRCVPGISDLDFVVIIESTHETELMNSLARVYKSLKRLYPVMGEVHLVSQESWSKYLSSIPATSIWFSSSREYSREERKVGGKERPKQSSIESRTALALYHYWKAHGFLCRSLREHPKYYLRHFQREISKSIDFISGTPLRLRYDQPWQELLVTALMRIEEYARTILKSTPFSRSLKVSVKLNGAERFGNEICQRRWLGRLREFSEISSKIGITSIPGVMEVIPVNGGNELGGILQSFYKAFGGQSLPPLLLLKNGTEVIRRGLGWGYPSAHLDWISPQEKEDKSFIDSLSYLSEVMIRERLILNLTLFRGKAISTTLEKIHPLFEEVFFCYYTLTTGVLNNDSAIVKRALKESFPSLPSNHRSDYLAALAMLEKNLGFSLKTSGSIG